MSAAAYIYECAEPPTDALRFSCRLRVEMVGKKQKVLMDWLPVSFYGATADEARTKALTHWDDAIEAERKKRANIAAAADRRRKPTQPDIEAEAEQAVGLGAQP